MQNFNYCTPTRLIFGEGVIANLPNVIALYGKKVLFTYGGGSIKQTGLYDKVKELLADCEIYELSGIEPNPKYDPSVLEGVKICKEQGIEVILSVGGGSVLDCSKAISVGAKYDGDVWDLITRKVKAQDNLPVIDIMTLAATGSEYDAACVISRTDTNDKVAYIDRHLYPKYSLLDPVYTYSVSAKQTAAGCADAMNHVMEQYFAEDATLLNDGMCEAALKSLITNTPLILKNPEDYRARAEMMYCCTLACNNIFSLGNSPSGWPMHAIEHALSAYYDITHGEGLAIITPHWMSYILSEQTQPRFVKYGINVFGIDSSLSPSVIADMAIEDTSKFFESLGMPMHLKDVGIDESRIPEMARHVAENEGLEHAWVPLREDDIAAILTDSL